VTRNNPPPKRTTLSVLPTLATLAGQQTPPGPSLSSQVETIARRYQAIVEASLPTSLPHEAMRAAIELAQSMDTTHPLAHNTLYGMCRSQRGDSRLAYAAENLTPANLYAIIHLAERLAATLGPGPYQAEQLAPYLPSKPAI
jgi:hypothetical protein